METFLLVGTGVVACVVFVVIAYVAPELGRKTCRECGSNLPVIPLAAHSQHSAVDDWACPKCGTAFDRGGRARGQIHKLGPS